MHTVRWLRFCLMLLLALLVGVAAGFRFTEETTPVALVMKVIQDVTRKNETTDWTKAIKGDVLKSGDAVRTGDQSLAVIKFTTDNSILRIREKSLLKLNTAGNMKTVDIQDGGFGFSITKQKENEKFQFTSPTSVASIRGTKGKMSRGRSGDTLVVTEGLVNLKNTVTNKEVEVGAGSIGFSSDDGSISSRKATPEELADAALAAAGSGNSQLNIELKDSKGNKKQLRIDFKK